MAEELPKIRFKGSKTEYYYDARLREVRNVNNPNDHHNLDNNEDSALDYFVEQNKERVPFKLSDLREQEQSR